AVYTTTAPGHRSAPPPVRPSPWRPSRPAPEQSVGRVPAVSALGSPGVARAATEPYSDALPLPGSPSVGGPPAQPAASMRPLGRRARPPYNDVPPVRAGSPRSQESGPPTPRQFAGGSAVGYS